jgi:hypothetical protein
MGCHSDERRGIMTLTREAPMSSTRHTALVGKGLAVSTVVITLLLSVAAAAGLFFDAYDDETEFARNAYRGADLVSMSMAVPLLLGSCIAAMRGSVRGRLLWLGSIAYCVYQYAYVFAYRWGELFPVHLLLFSLSSFTLVAALAQVHVAEVADSFDDGSPRRGTAWFLWVLAGGLGLMEGMQMSVALVSGETPEIVELTGHVTSPVYILDLGFVVPLMVVAGLWLRRAMPWGFVAAPIMLLKGVMVGFGLLAANLVATVSNASTDGPLIALWALIGVGSAVALTVLLWHVDPQRTSHGGPHVRDVSVGATDRA